MISSLRRQSNHIAAFVAVTIKDRLAHTAWFWADVIGQVVVMAIFVHFWRAIYAGTEAINGIDVNRTVAYVLVANAIGRVMSSTIIFELGPMIRDGKIVIELLRPVDFQLRMYAWSLTTVVGTMLQHMVLLGLFACLFLGLTLPTSPLVWLWFLLSLLTGHAILFFFDWTISLVAFYSTEVRGLAIFREGVVCFFSGLVLPLALMPAGLQRIAAWLPIGQILDTPVRILTGMTPLSAAPRTLAIQLLWLAGVALVSRPAFRIAIRRITVQGG